MINNNFVILNTNNLDIKDITNILLLEENLIIKNKLNKDYHLFIKDENFIQISYFLDYLNLKRNIIIAERYEHKIIDIRIQPFLKLLYHHNLTFYNLLVNTFHFYSFKRKLENSNSEIFFKQLKNTFKNNLITDIQNFILEEMYLFLYHINKIFSTRLYANPYIGEMQEKLTDFYIYFIKSEKDKIINKKKYILEILKN